jgi:hypothetical protein
MPLRHPGEGCADGCYLLAVTRCKLVEDGVILPCGCLLFPVAVQWVGNAPAIALNLAQMALQSRQASRQV